MWGFVAMAAISAISSYMNSEAQNDAAEEEKKAVEENAKLQEMQQENKRVDISNLNTQNSLMEQQRGLKERASLKVSQSEGGLSGSSIDRILSNSKFNTDTNLQIIDRNTSGELAQNKMDTLSMRKQNEGRINQANSRITSGGMQALQIGMAGLSGYSSAGGFK